MADIPTKDEIEERIAKLERAAKAANTWSHQDTNRVAGGCYIDALAHEARMISTAARALREEVERLTKANKRILERTKMVT